MFKEIKTTIKRKLIKCKEKPMFQEILVNKTAKSNKTLK
jgi:hypothetical protein